MMTLTPDPATLTGDRERSAFPGLLATLDAMEIPRGARAEILDGKTITVSPMPTGLHGRNVHTLARRFTSRLRAGVGFETYLELRMPLLQRSVVPDFFVAPEEVLHTAEHHIPPDEVQLVAEVVSKGSTHGDRKEKAGIYARAAIELYLLVDPPQGQSTLYSRPREGRYSDRCTRRFGEEIAIPEPFHFLLDTEGFLRYE